MPDGDGLLFVMQFNGLLYNDSYRMIHLKAFLLLLIRFYKKNISPFLPLACRYYPTCSEYCYEAIHKHGIIKGIFYGIFRILRCNPLFKGGYDPVP